MRGKIFLVFCGVAAVPLGPVVAAEQLKFGKAPDWVVPSSIPTGATKSDAPVSLLLSDQQFNFEQGKIVSYSETAMRIQNPQGLAAGNISFNWDPATDTVTINKLQIRRGDKVIDVLGSGQTFTIMRRETNLELAMLDGTLTANIQPEGLQEGDIIDFAATVEHSDPVLKGHAEAVFAGWNGTPISAARARLIWPSRDRMKVRQSVELPVAKRSQQGGTSILELSASNIQPLIPPKGAPLRFTIGRMAEATDFDSWGDVAALFAPLYDTAAIIPRTGLLRDELDRIRNSVTDPKTRAEQALALVQDRIRYVALSMGQGGYVPASAETTWSRRFGDCKGKTALLLGLLHELNIEAEPVLVSSRLGDAIADRLPMVGLFDHVLVRALIAGKTYWLDGTRTGDTDLDQIRVPNFGWGLPLIRNAGLIRLVPQPLEVPEKETRAEIDASGGIYAPAPVTIETLLRGDSAVVFQTGLSSLTEAQRQEYFRSYLRQDFDFVTLKSATYVFDRPKRELRIAISGDAKLDWSSGYFHVPESTVGYNPDFDRAAGPLHDVPFAVAHPQYDRTLIKIRVPRSFLGKRRIGGSAEVHETLAGVEYVRRFNVRGDELEIETSQRSLVPEVAYKEAIAAEARLKALADEDISLPLPRSYRETDQDLAAVAAEKPTSKDQYFRRALVFLDAGKFDEAIADLNQTITLDPKNVWPLANRGLAYVHKRDWKAAEADLKAASVIDSNNAVVLRARALMAENKDDCATAIEHFTKSLAVDRGNSFAIGHRALCERSIGKDAEALADSEVALKADPGWMDLRVMRANILFLQGKTDAVAREAELLVEENPTSNYAFVAAGAIYGRIDRPADAMKAFDRALAIKPEAYVYVNRARIRPYSDSADRIADLDSALKLEPGNPDALSAKAELLANGGKYAEALKLYDQIKVDEDADYFTARRAVVLNKLGRKSEAEAVLQSLHSKAENSKDFNRLCWAKAIADMMMESALRDCQEAIRLDPNNRSAMDSFGLVLLRLGKLDDAIAAYDKAVAKKSGSASYMGRALAYARKGDSARAAADRTEALRLDKDVEYRFATYGLKLETVTP